MCSSVRTISAGQVRQKLRTEVQADQFVSKLCIVTVTRKVYGTVSAPHPLLKGIEKSREVESGSREHLLGHLVRQGPFECPIALPLP